MRGSLNRPRPQILDLPVGSIAELSDDVAGAFPDLRELATYFEFIDHLDYFDLPDCLNFCDESGHRYRILVIGLEVVLCVAVPRDFDPRKLTLSRFSSLESDVLVERYDGRVHRALRYRHESSGCPELVDAHEAAQLLVTSEPEQAGVRAREFDRTWLALMDPIGRIRRPRRPAVGTLLAAWRRLSCRRREGEQ